MIGDLFTFGILFNFTKSLEPKISFAIAAYCAALFGLIFLFIVKEPDMKKIHKASNDRMLRHKLKNNDG